MNRVVDLRSDTVTRPSPAMRAAIAAAEVDDDVLGKDPTVERLERRTAELLGKQAALFFPSGTQANQTGILLHTEPGSEAICEADAHVFHYEYASASWLAGVQLVPVASERGRLPADGLRAAIRPGDRHHPRTTLICVEQTHGASGGSVVPLDALAAVRGVADEHGLPIHMDGARLWHAAVALDRPPADVAATADTVMVSLSKGLGCPVGSLLAGPAELIERAWTIRKRLGGGMRQVGILAAAGLHALEHHLPRLGEDHARARRMYEACREIDGLSPVEPDTNTLRIDVTREGLAAGEIERRLRERDVWILALGPDWLRAVTHRDVDEEGVDRAIEALRGVMS
ncbi:MAG: threonine aldolase family protein [Gemmatimonadota bacterium]